MAGPKTKQKRTLTPEQRKKISDGVKRAYAEGRLTPPTIRPEVAAKISESKQKSGYRHSEETKQKMSIKLQEKIKSGEWNPQISQEMRTKAANALRGKRRSKETRDKISAGVKARWEEGKYTTRASRDIWCSPIEELIVDELIELGFEYQKAFTVPDQWKNTPNTRYYRPDFVHDKAKIIVEIDGGDHSWSDKVRARDAIRTAFFESRGFTFLRFPNKEIEDNKEEVLSKIKSHLP